MTDPTTPASQTPSSDTPAVVPPAPPPVAAHWEAPPAEPGPAPGIEFGGFGERLLAYIIDGIILTVVIGGLLVVGFIIAGVNTDFRVDPTTGEIVPGSVEFDPGAWLILGLLFLIATVLGILYFPWFWARGGQTPGMRPFRLYVVRDSDGSRIGWGPALLRVIGFWVSSVVFYVGFIWILIDKRRRGWHDLIAGTVVIKRT
ncbi:MAG TPA: RDD family protein [Candidatus Limnocylindrales bacterium]